MVGSGDDDTDYDDSVSQEESVGHDESSGHPVDWTLVRGHAGQFRLEGITWLVVLIKHESARLRMRLHEEEALTVRGHGLVDHITPTRGPC